LAACVARAGQGASARDQCTLNCIRTDSPVICAGSRATRFNIPSLPVIPLGIARASVTMPPLTNNTASAQSIVVISRVYFPN
jgi:hypothetical protein